MKGFKKVMTVIILVLISLVLFHYLNTAFPKNIVRRTINGLMLVLTPVLLSAILVYLVNPFTNTLIKKYKFNKKAAISLTIVLLIVALSAIFSFVGYFLFNQGRELLQVIMHPSFINNIKAWFMQYNLMDLYNYIENFLVTFNIEDYIGTATSLVGSVLQGLAAIILTPIFLWHFLNYQENIYDIIDSNIPNTWKEHVIPITIKSNEVVASYFRSKLISMVMLFLMFVFVYLGLGLPIGYVILFAILISLLDLIPYIGPTTALLIPIIYIFSTNGVNPFYQTSWHINAITTNIILLGINFVIQLVQGNVIIPKLAGKEMDINPALILVFMLFFGSILGVWGIILSIPLGGIVLVIWEHMKERGLLDNARKEE